MRRIDTLLVIIAIVSHPWQLFADDDKTKLTPNKIISDILDVATSGNHEKALNDLKAMSCPLIYDAKKIDILKHFDLYFKGLTRENEYIGHDLILLRNTKDNKYFVLVYLHKFKRHVDLSTWYMHYNNKWQIINHSIGRDLADDESIKMLLEPTNYTLGTYGYIEEAFKCLAEGKYADTLEIFKYNHCNSSEYDSNAIHKVFIDTFTYLGGIKSVNILYCQQYGNSMVRVVHDIKTRDTQLLGEIFLRNINGKWMYYKGSISSRHPDWLNPILHVCSAAAQPLLNTEDSRPRWPVNEK